MDSRFFHCPKPRIFGHRGSSGNVPENTLLSFEKALEEGADILEMDVHATSDGHIVVLHDPLLDRTTDGNGWISRTSLAEVERLDAGYFFSLDGKTLPFRGRGLKIPTLREVAERFPLVPFNIEIKQSLPRIERAVYQLLQETNHIDLVLFAAQSDDLMKRIRLLDSRVPTNFTYNEVRDFLKRVYLGQWKNYRPPGQALQIPHYYKHLPILTRHFVKKAHRHEIEVHVWTVNDEKKMRKMLAMGVDGIMTDYPERLRKTAESLHLREQFLAPEDGE